ncbi:hypothetical protein [Catelliglobosispora koreensis]|uniref:hypothetical protein n=1 Tax=Catelliglobosispora koreensis TaxID=129052 RepID=UPI00036DCF10|nr:hypothetical protein [Catelliglobosispora koreensis]
MSEEGPNDAQRLQILATEHWSLLASRSLAWNESFSRAGMFLSTLSGATVALALIAQASGFGKTFSLFALAVLPVVFFVGITTYIRLDGSNYHDAQCVLGMNRIRNAYLQIAPDLKKYFVMSPHDDPRGIGVTMGVQPSRNNLLHLIAATPVVVAVLTSVVGGVIGSLIGYQLDWNNAWLTIAGVGTFIVVFGLLMFYAKRSIDRAQKSMRPLFPSPPQP